jgi:hypothetical protein
MVKITETLVTNMNETKLKQDRMGWHLAPPWLLPKLLLS